MSIVALYHLQPPSCPFTLTFPLGQVARMGENYACQRT